MNESNSLIKSITAARCPRCREGKMFISALYSLSFMKMHAVCKCCGQPFRFEPGFFLGSAFFSYVINATLLIGIALWLYYSGRDITIGVAALSMLIVVFGLLPVTLRLSKSLWIHLFIRYEGPCSKIPRK